MKELIITFVFLICYSYPQAQEFQPNYNETKVPENMLPDVLKTAVGKLVIIRRSGSDTYEIIRETW